MQSDSRNKVQVTVAICTLNHAESLRRTLNSLAKMSVPQDLIWEVVVVNNDCTDHTDTVIEAFADQLPIRQEFEAKRGLSLARNRAVECARGNYIAWTDDDVVVEPGWLAAYADAFRRWPEAALFGGPVVPKYDSPLPKLFADAEPFLSSWVFWRRDVDDEGEITLSNNVLPVGANFVLHATEQRAFRYDPELDPGPGQRRLGGDTDVIRQILEAGGVGRWIPGAGVEHCSQPERLTLEYVRGNFRALGESEAVIAARGGNAGPLLLRAPRWRWRQLLIGWIGYLQHRLFSPPSVWLPYLGQRDSAAAAIRYWRTLENTARVSNH
jgi:glycosyltransferase involved in cell wall biosynthesis